MRWQIGAFVFDSTTRSIEGGDIPPRVIGPTDAKVLRLLIERYDQEYNQRQVARWLGDGIKIQDGTYTAMTKLRNHMGRHYFVTRPAYRLQHRPILLDHPKDVVSAPAAEPITSQVDGACCFGISIDGITLNAAAELIYGIADTDRIRSCRHLYRSAIEDVAFAVVYGSRLSSRFRSREEVAASDVNIYNAVTQDPAQTLISHLPSSIYRPDRENQQFWYGRLLDDDQSQVQIAHYITSLGKGLATSLVRQLCREWLVREAEVCFGEHASVFGSARTNSELQFARAYYDSPLLEKIPDLLGQNALDSLTGFVPRRPRSATAKKSSEQYSELARRQFVLRNVLSLITIMYEYERTAHNHPVHRLPFILRAAIKRQSDFDWGKDKEWKTILVRAALDEALWEAQDAYDREELIQRLVWVRGHQAFVTMRSRLDELTAMMTEQRTKEIESLIKDINTMSHRGRNTCGVGISQTMVVPNPMIRRVDPKEYLERLEMFFPELQPQLQ